jgi:3-oxoacyl-[acyl-carrier-protein] synthase-3
VGLSGVAGILPRHEIDLAQLAADGRLSSSLQTLSDFGFARAHVAAPDQSASDLAIAAARAALADARLPPEDIDFVVWASARPENHLKPSDCHGPATPPNFMDGFRYASAWLQDVLDLHNAEVVAVAQQGCSTMFAAVRVARALLLADPRRTHALCVGVDVLPADAPREILYNVISDAACAVVVSRGCSRDRWIGDHQISRGYYWDPVARREEIVAAYFPTAKMLVDQLLARHRLTAADIDLVVPTGVNCASWDILLRLLRIPPDRLYRGRPSFGHTMTSDNFLYLETLRQSGAAPAGARLLLFTYGFGSSWCGILLEH